MAATLVVALLLAATTAGCRIITADREALRLGNWSDLSERELGLVEGSTSEQAAAAAQTKGLVGVRTDSLAGEGFVVSALTADFQTRVHLFENDRYLQSVVLRSGSSPPFGAVVRFAASDEGLLLLVLHRSADDLVAPVPGSAGPRIDVFARRGRWFEFARTVSLAGIAADNGGLTNPLFVGHDLSDGILFLARDRDGVVWKSAYLLSMRHGEERFAPLPLDEAARCSCVSDYLYGGG
ncbi:MAG: hypothetical protein QM765_49435 [Myxococcales bacterium]